MLMPLVLGALLALLAWAAVAFNRLIRGANLVWAAQFSGVLERAAQEQSGNGYRPGWYTGSALSRFGGAQFGSALTSSLSSTIASSSTPPGSSSGSSGGGSSGGGGGGW